ncbi:MAG: metallophosphoesterase family protein, partial [Chloroflexota bacterium]
MSDYIEHDHQDDGIDRRGFLKCMAWAGTGVVWALSGGRVTSSALADVPKAAKAAAGADFTFVQISDSHIGFHQAPNKNVLRTFEEAVSRINALPSRPAFVMHTGDHVHLSTIEEFDTVKHVMGTIKTDRTFNVPGEHDVFVDHGKRYLWMFGKGSRGAGYYSFDLHGVHFLALANVQQAEGQGGLKGLGLLGSEQLAFIKKDLVALSPDTPLVLFSHVPLLAVYPNWGWATADSTQVLALVKRFSSVTALNGHIHQIISKTEGNITMHTAASTAYPLHAPGQVAPTPLVIPAPSLPRRIGIRTVDFVQGASSLALKDES